ncbi:MAG: choice-of-anchor L domain-containing protein [Saprospiraceae bacterium]
MKYTPYIAVLFLCFCSIGFTKMPTVMDSIETTFAFTPEELVKNHFIKGSCQNVYNIQTIGNELGLGYFSNAEDVLGISKGIIISTGNIEDAVGPNNDIGTTTTFNNIIGDEDLDIFSTSVVIDATGIEFDFIPFSNQVTFKYAFASEEYCEFVGSIFNDNFGFFVSGPGISGEFFNDAINVATIPNSNDYVSINTVNHISNSSFYVKNELPEDATQCGIPSSANYLEEIEFDGFTTPLKATIDVIPCETYHIRLVVGDVGDDKLDSAVFLETKSFDLGGEVSVVAKSAGSNEPIAYENCRNGEFIFTRGTNSNLSQPLPVDFVISPISEAISGVDFEPLPSSITIPVGQNTYTLPVNILPDNLVETPELLRLDILFDCECLASSAADLFIEDLVELEGTFEEIYVCPDQEFTIGPTVTGGAAPYEFIWNTSATTPRLTETVDQPTHFTVTITDGCGDTTLAIAGIGIQNQPTATLSGTAQICEGDTAFLNVEMEGNPPWSINYSIDGLEQPTLENISNNPFTLPIYETGEYELLDFTDAYCEGIAVGIGNVTSNGVELSYTFSPPSCPGANDGSIDLNVSAGIPPYSILWDKIVNDDMNPTELTAGTYNISLTDANDCLISETIELLNPESYNPDCINNLFYVPNAFSPNDDGENDLFTIYFAENNFITNVKKVSVFSRWGDLILEKNNILTNPSIDIWDGKFKGKKMNVGIFVWMMEVELLDGTSQIFSGDLTLVK